MSIDSIPFNRPCLTGDERRYMDQALAYGQISGDGAFTKRCHALLKEVLGSSAVLLTTSCTHALEICALLLDIQPGDEVILPSFTFVSTVNAFVLRGARPIFADVRPDTLNVDECRLEALITPRTRAIVPVHYAGVGCERVRLPIIPSWCDQSYHMFYLLLPGLVRRSAFIQHLWKYHIHSVFHYLPLHLSPGGRQYGYTEGDCPVTEDVSDRLVRLPFYNDLTCDDLARIVAAIQDFRC